MPGVFDSFKADFRGLFKTKPDKGFVLGSIVTVSGLAVSLWSFILLLREGSFHFGIVNLIGLSLIVIGHGIRLQARRTLDRFFSVRLKTSADHELVKQGIYRYVRHPAYLGYLIACFGYPLLLSSWYGFFIMLLNIPVIIYRIKIEEEILIKTFGEKYLDYRKFSKKLIPYIY
jgi:protein-S-isoprenylcysteine O-methyltransferase Ste14